MPAEQLLYLMGANFSSFKTLIIKQSIHVMSNDEHETEKLLTEKIWLKAPGFYRSEVISGSEVQDIEDPLIMHGERNSEMFFRRLFMVNDPDSIMSFLSNVGVDIDSVFYTRFEGSVAYLLGRKSPESPKLVIGKDTFFPLFFSYRVQTQTETTLVNVRFEDYQNLDKGWYPYEITYLTPENVIERYVVLDLEVNPSIEGPLSEITAEVKMIFRESDVSQESPEDKRLRELIELFKEKYR